jgi:hypothetical protein
MRRPLTRFALTCVAVGHLACQAQKPAATPGAATPPSTVPQHPTALQETPAMALQCELSVSPRHEVGEPVELLFRLTNPSARTLHVLRWHSPLEGFFNDFLTVTRDGTELPYQGPVMKRGDPSAEDYVTLAPGASVEARVDVSLAYDMKQPGRYRIAFIDQLRDLTANEAEVPRPLSAHQPVAVKCPVVETTLVAP